MSSLAFLLTELQVSLFNLIGQEELLRQLSPSLWPVKREGSTQRYARSLFYDIREWRKEANLENG